jgi:fructose-specific phosphotransferase system IIC component
MRQHLAIGRITHHMMIGPFNKTAIDVMTQLLNFRHRNAPEKSCCHAGRTSPTAWLGDS